MRTITSFGSVHHSCFAAGTPVHTKLGLRAIESIRVGDQVLSQDPATGSLSFQPVVAVFRNPPTATLKIAFENHTDVITTPIHRFWLAGKGWTMARDLKPGQPVRSLGGVIKVESTTNQQVRPVFNLEVAVHSDYLVGRDGLLVHDHSLVKPALEPFDASARRP
jgi:hypothetical protein